jgi:hypothetical protein
MNVNSSLILEVSRINSLMYPKLISENFLLDDVATKIIKLFDNSPILKEIAQELGITTEKLSDDIVKIKNNDDLLNFLNSRVMASPTLKKEILGFLMANLSDTAKTGIASIEKLMIDEIKKNPSLKLTDLEKMSDDFVDQVIQTDYKMVSDEIKNGLKNKLRDEFSYIRQGKKSPNKGVVDKIKVTGENWYESLKACGLTNYELISVSKAIPLRKIRLLQGSFMKSITTYNEKLETKALERAFGNIKMWVEKLDNTGVNDNSLLLNANNILLSLKNDKLQSTDIFRDEVINAIRRAEGPNGEKVASSTIAKIEKGLKTNIPTDPNAPSWIRDIMLEFTPDLIKTITKMDTKNLNSFSYKLFDSVISIISVGSIRRLDELLLLFDKLGPKKAVARIYLMAQYINKLIIPIVTGILYCFVDFPMASIGLVPAMQDWWERVKKDVLMPLKKKFENASIGWLMNPFETYWDDIGKFISTLLGKMSQGTWKGLKDTFIEYMEDAKTKTNDELVKRGYPPITDTTTTIPSTDTTGTSTPPQTSGLPEAFNSFTPYATFEKIDDNKYKMKFKSDLPPDFSDLKNYETTAEKSGDKWIWYYTDGTSMEF